MKSLILILFLVGCGKSEVANEYITKYEWEKTANRCESICNVIECTNTEGYKFYGIININNGNEKRCSCKCRIGNDEWSENVGYY